MKRVVTIAVAVLVLVSINLPGGSAKPKSERRGQTHTAAAGGWEGTPPAIPTSIDPETGRFEVVGHAVWNGTWVGVSVFEMTGTVDLATGDYVATATTEFTGTWLVEGSHGKLFWTESMTGNLITGEFSGTFDIVRGSGDPAFECSSGHFTWSGFSPAFASYGGYSGTWIHGCPS